MKPNIDLNKYAGLTAAEAAQRRAEDERRAIREDPRYIAAVRQGQQERAAREPEVERRRQQVAAQREAEAKRQLEAEKERQRRLWAAAGNPAEKFEAAWPELERRYLIQKAQAQAEHWESII